MLGGWKQVTRSLPAVGVRVDLIRHLNNTVCPVWESTGFLMSDGKWMITKSDGLILKNCTPTHWRYIK